MAGQETDDVADGVVVAAAVADVVVVVDVDDGEWMSFSTSVSGLSRRAFL